MKKIKNVKKRWIKNIVEKSMKLIKPNEKFHSEITVLICMTTFDGYGSSWENFFIAAMVNPSLKSRFMQEFSRFSRILAGFVG